MNLGIEGRVALVLGASRGIGRAIATALAREGARVAVAARSSTELEDVAREIEGDARAFAADTLDLDRMHELPRVVASALGPIEILVLNTGGPPPGPRFRIHSTNGRRRSARSYSPPRSWSRR